MAVIEAESDDVALDALQVLSDVTAESIERLEGISADLARMRRQRLRGWSWRRIAAGDKQASLAKLTEMAAALGQAGGGFRRCLARSLRQEGMRVHEIGDLMEVSRQRIGTLIRATPRR